MEHPYTRAALLVTLGGLAFMAQRFYRGQNRAGAKGGAISGPKMAWLFFTVYLWFLACPLAALDPGLRPGVRLVLGAFSASMWLRGAAELYMLYVTKNWRPPIGVAHDLFCILLVALGVALVPGAWPGVGSAGDLWQTSLLALVLFSLGVETAYAALFFRAVEGKTVGEDGVWFAAEHEARFARINRLTFWLNVPQYAVLAALLASAVAGLAR
jgi:hypothetical protein